MENFINVIEQVINSKNIWVAVIGLLFIVLGIVIGVFKQTWLISGSSFFSYMEDETVDYIAIFVGLFVGIIGGYMFLGVFIFTYFDIMDYFHRFASLFLLLSALFLAILCLLIIVKIKNNKEKNKKNQ